MIKQAKKDARKQASSEQFDSPQGSLEPTITEGAEQGPGQAGPDPVEASDGVGLETDQDREPAGEPDGAANPA